MSTQAQQQNKVYYNRPNPAPLQLELDRPVHLIAAGGVGMSALGLSLAKQGFQVSGSDASESPYLDKLAAAGAQTYVGHQASHVPKNAIVVASSAIDSDNPEIQQAITYGLPIFHRSDLLREILKRFEVSIGLTGTHGKTTLTGMAGMILEEGGLDPTILAGGKVPKLGTNAKVGENTKYVVAELDESDGTVTQYCPEYSVIANLELDHPDHFQGGLADVIRTFETYLEQLSPTQTVLFNMDCPNTRELYYAFRNRLKAVPVYTESVPTVPEEGAYWLDNVLVHLEGGYQGDVYYAGECIGQLWLQVPGRHNLSNALLSSIIGYRLGISFDSIRRTLENFTGMGRRFERLGVVNGARIIDDYAHHPTEVQATLRAAREYNRYKGRVIAMFQPHRYGRLQTLWDEFAASFEDADEVIVVDVYAAGEAPIEGVSGQLFANAMTHAGCEYWPSADWDLVAARVKSILTPGDLFITMGAGDVTVLGRKLVAQP